MRRQTALAAAFAALALPAAAQETSGTITANLNLNDSVWRVVPQAGDAASGWSRTDAGMRITLVGTAATVDDPSSDGGLVVSFTVDEPGPNAEANDLDIRYHHPANAEPAFIARDAPGELTLTAFAAEGEDITLAGEFSAVLTLPGDPQEALDAIPVYGDFQATVSR